MIIALCLVTFFYDIAGPVDGTNDTDKEWNVANVIGLFRRLFLLIC